MAYEKPYRQVHQLVVSKSLARTLFVAGITKKGETVFMYPLGNNIENLEITLDKDQWNVSRSYPAPTVQELLNIGCKEFCCQIKSIYPNAGKWSLQAMFRDLPVDDESMPDAFARLLLKLHKQK